MRTLILFYSRTGHSRTVAGLLAQALRAPSAEIACRAYVAGFGGLRQAFDVLAGLSPPIEVPELVHQDWDLVVIGGPVWGGRPATPLRSYLRRQAGHHRRLALFVTCKGTSPAYPPERAIAEMSALVPRRVVGTQIFTEAQIGGAELAIRVAGFAQALSTPAEPPPER